MSCVFNVLFMLVFFPAFASFAADQEHGDEVLDPSFNNDGYADLGYNDFENFYFNFNEKAEEPVVETTKNPLELKKKRPRESESDNNSSKRLKPTVNTPAPHTPTLISISPSPMPASQPPPPTYLPLPPVYLSPPPTPVYLSSLPTVQRQQPSWMPSFGQPMPQLLVPINSSQQSEPKAPSTKRGKSWHPCEPGMTGCVELYFRHPDGTFSSLGHHFSNESIVDHGNNAPSKVPFGISPPDFDPPLSEDALGWVWNGRSLFSIFKKIDLLSNPLQTIRRADPEEQQNCKNLKNAGCKNPIKRMMFILAVQPTQDARCMTIQRLLYLLDRNDPMYGECKDILPKLRLFSDEFGARNPFGLLFEKIRKDNIQPNDKNIYKRFIETPIGTIRSEHL